MIPIPGTSKTGNGNKCILIPGTSKKWEWEWENSVSHFPAPMVAGVGNIPSRHLYINISLSGTGIGNGRAPTLMCGAIDARPTHGSEPTQTKRAGRKEKRKRKW